MGTLSAGWSWVLSAGNTGFWHLDLAGFTAHLGIVTFHVPSVRHSMTVALAGVTCRIWGWQQKFTSYTLTYDNKNDKITQ